MKFSWELVHEGQEETEEISLPSFFISKRAALLKKYNEEDFHRFNSFFIGEVLSMLNGGNPKNLHKISKAMDEAYLKIHKEK